MGVIPDGWLSVFDLAQQLATPGVDAKPLIHAGDIRRSLDIAFNVHGYTDPAGADRPQPGVIKHIRKMTERGEIRPLFGQSGFPASDIEEITDIGWWLSPEDAQRVRGQLAPAGRQFIESAGEGNPQTPQNSVPNGADADTGTGRKRSDDLTPLVERLRRSGASRDDAWLQLRDLASADKPEFPLHSLTKTAVKWVRTNRNTGDTQILALDKQGFQKRFDPPRKKTPKGG